MSDLDKFYILKARLKRGETLSRADRNLYRTLGRSWIILYRSLKDKRGVSAIKKDMNMLLNKQPKRVDPLVEVM